MRVLNRGSLVGMSTSLVGVPLSGLESIANGCVLHTMHNVCTGPYPSCIVLVQVAMSLATHLCCLHALPSFLVRFIFFFKMKHATKTGLTTYMGVGNQESIPCSATGACTDGLCTKRSCEVACCVSSFTSFVCLHHPFQFCLLDMPPKKSKKSLEPKKLIGSPCYICGKNGCQMACLHYDKHDTRPKAPAPQNYDEQDMHRMGV